MRAGSHMPSGVLMVTSVSDTGIVAADAGPVAATTPAATDMPMKSRRDRSLAASACLARSFLSSSIIGSLLFEWLGLEFPNFDPGFAKTISLLVSSVNGSHRRGYCQRPPVLKRRVRKAMKVKYLDEEQPHFSDA